MTLEIVCWHCNERYPIRDYFFEKISPFGKNIKCQRCEKIFTVMRPELYYNENFSPEVAAFIIDRIHSRAVGNIEYDVNKILLFEKRYLQRMSPGKTLSQVTSAEIDKFFMMLKKQLTKDQVKGISISLDALYSLLVKEGFVLERPFSLKDEKKHVKLPGEVKSYLKYKKLANPSANLDFDIGRINDWQSFLEKKGKSFTNAKHKDFSEFKKKMSDSSSVQQVAGYTATIFDFYKTLLEHDEVGSNPVFSGKEVEQAVINAGEIKRRSRERIEKDRSQIMEWVARGFLPGEIASKMGMTTKEVNRELKVITSNFKTESAFNPAEQRGWMLAKLDLLEKEFWAGWERDRENPVFLEGVERCLEHRLRLLAVPEEKRKPILSRNRTKL